MVHLVTPRFCVLCGSGLVRPKDLGGREVPPFLCPECGHRVWQDPKVAAAVIVTVDDEVVLIRRAQHDKAYGQWILPGGFVDLYEPVPSAARREVLEELGVTVELVDLIGVYSHVDEPVVTVVYEGMLVDGEMIPGEARAEALEVGRFGQSEIPWSDLGFRSTFEALEEFSARPRRIKNRR